MAPEDQWIEAEPAEKYMHGSAQYPCDKFDRMLGNFL